MTLHITWVDWLVIAVYFVFILGLGFYLKRFTKTGRTSSWRAGRTAPGSRASPFCPRILGALELLGMTGNTYQIRDVSSRTSTGSAPFRRWCFSAST